jgi:hypothetical protein
MAEQFLGFLDEPGGPASPAAAPERPAPARDRASAAERDLRSRMFTPEESDQILAREVQPDARAAFRRAIDAERDPKAKAILLSEYERDAERATRLAGQTPAATGDQPIEEPTAETMPVRAPRARRVAAPATRHVPELVGFLDDRPLEEPAAAKPKPAGAGLGTRMADLGVSAAAGVGSLVEMGGTIARLATGEDNFVRQFGEEVREYWEGRKSEDLKAREQTRRQRIDSTEGEFGKAIAAISATISDPPLFAAFLAEQIPQFIPGMAVGRALTGVATALKAGEAATRAAGIGGAVAAGAAFQGADIAGDTIERLLKLPDHVWAQHPGFAAAVAAGEDPAAAKQRIATQEGRQAFALAGAVSALAQAIPGGTTIERVLAGVGGRGGGFLRGAIKGLVGEGISEGVEEGSGQAIANLGVQSVDPSQSLTQGVGEATGLGTLMGGTFGGALGGFQRPGEPPRAKPKDEDGAVPVEEVLGPQPGQSGGGATVDRNQAATVASNLMPVPVQVSQPTQEEQQRQAVDRLTEIEARERELSQLVAEGNTDTSDDMAKLRAANAKVEFRVLERERRQIVTAMGGENAARDVMAGSRPVMQVSADGEASPVEAAGPVGAGTSLSSPPGSLSTPPAAVETPEDAPTPAELKAEALSQKRSEIAKREAAKRAKIDIGKDSLLTAIAKLGGLKRDQAIGEWGLDPKGIPKSGLFGRPILRATGGNTLDAMGEKLAELGYLPVDEHGKHDLASFEALLDRELRGEPQYTPEGWEARARAEREAEVPEAEAAAIAPPPDVAALPAPQSEEIDALELSPEDIAEFERHDAGEQASAEALVEGLRGRFDGTEAESLVDKLIERAAIETQDQPASAFHAAIIRGVREVKARAQDPQGQPAPQERGTDREAGEAPPARGPPKGGPAERPAQEEAPALELAPQSPDDLRRRDDESKARAEAIRKEQERAAAPPPADFTLTGSDRPADQAAARGQGGLFEKPEPAAPATDQAGPRGEAGPSSVPGQATATPAQAQVRPSAPPESVGQVPAPAVAAPEESATPAAKVKAEAERAKQPRKGKAADSKPTKPPAKQKPIAAEIDRAKEKQARADLDAALGELGELLGKNVKKNITPEQEQKLLPILTRVFDAAFRLGYLKFKQAARFVLETIRAKFGNDIADKITIDHLQGAYIALGRDGKSSKSEVISYDSLASLVAESDAGVESSASEVSANGLVANPEALTNLSAVQPGAKERRSRGDVEPLRSVYRLMRRIAEDREVLDSVVRSIPVDVVNVLRREEFSPESLFHNPSVLENLAGLRGNAPVSGGVSAARAVIEATAAFAAKPAGAEHLRGASFDLDAALNAIEGGRSGSPSGERIVPTESTALEAAAAEADTSPSEAQKDANNYRHGHLTVAGLDVSIENPAGSTRSGTGTDGKPWSVVLRSHYGYLRGTEGADGDHVDIFIKPGTPQDYDGPVFIVDQTKRNGHFDEHKLLLGWPTINEASGAFLENYDDPEAAKKRIRKVTEWTLPELKAWLESGKRERPAAESTIPTEAPNATSRDPDLERDRSEPDPQERVGEGAFLPTAGRDDRGDGQTGDLFGEARDPESGHPRLPDRRTTPRGEPGDQPIHRGDGELGTESGTAGSDQRRGSAPVRYPGVQPDAAAGGAAERTARTLVGLEQKRLAQRAAEKIPVQTGDLDNIRATLPYLLEGQQDDVKFAEDRFAAGGYGVLFTNGTGTGKTLVGLGIIKREARRGNEDILIVAPSDTILKAWIDSGSELGLKIQQLADTQTNGGRGITATTYANFQQNASLVKRQWGLVVFDEAHNLNQNKTGETTEAMRAMHAVAKHPNRGSYDFAKRLYPEEWAAYERASELAESYVRRRAPVPPEIRAELERARAAWQAAEAKAKPAWEARPRSRAVFLSATPFAYHKTTDWAEGYLFDYAPVEDAGYNKRSGGQDAFLIEKFGYRLRTNKLTEPEAGVDVSLMEIQFNQWLKDQKVLSARVLDVDADYDRRFILTESALGRLVDDGIDFLRDGGDYKSGHKWEPLWANLKANWQYHDRLYLLEALKARAAVPMVKKHLELGRKVVVFHGFNKGGGFHPFRFTKSPGRTVTYTVNQRPVTVKWDDLVDEFEKARPDLAKADFDGLGSPLTTFKKAFPDDAVFFNGTVSPKERLRAKNGFQIDNDPAVIIVVQQDAGGAGVSLHDQTGKHPRVLINLGLPIKPTQTIQTEGRIYRVGQASDAMFRYLNTGTNFERWTFASVISERAGTAENLALGAEARRLKDSFVEAFQDSGDANIGPDEGTGGKARDRADRRTITDFDKAITYYYAKQKRAERRDNRQGVDYFATPEPLALKMVEWAGIRPGDELLEPSAGHGAIARWFPRLNKAKMVEPSFELGTQAALVSGAELVGGRFEDHNIVNKYDAIVMNPPFGHGGSTAMEHLNKAAGHLRDGGRIVALIPTGPAADKAFEKWLYGDEKDKGLNYAAGMYLAADINLPRVTFERAGTSVAARIVVLDRINDVKTAEKVPQQVSRDWREFESIKDFFERIREAEMPGRPEVTKVQAATAKEKARGATVKAGKWSFVLAPDKTASGRETFTAKPTERVGDEFRSMASKAKSAGGYYVRGFGKFAFYSEADRQKFLDSLGGALSIDDATLPRDDDPTPEEGAPLESLRALFAAKSGLAIPEGSITRAPIPPALQPLAEWVRVRFGTEVVAYRVGEGAPRPIASIAGANLGGRLYIRANERGRAHLTVLGHEFLHQLRRDDEALYQEFIRLVRPYIDAGRYVDFFAAAKEKGYAEGEIFEEFMADVLGDAFTSESFWQTLGRQNPTLLERVYAVLRSLVQAARQALGGQTRMGPYLTDYDRVMRMAGVVVAKYAVRAEAQRAGRKGEGKLHRAYHGSPHDFDKFSLQKIGIGEGAQAYGWGMYFSSKKEVAEWYKRELKGRSPEAVRRAELQQQIDSLLAKESRARGEARHDRADELLRQAGALSDERDAIPEPKGRLYTVDLAPPEDSYLDWDRPLSEQSERVKAALATAGLAGPTPTPKWSPRADGGQEYRDWRGNRLGEFIPNKAGGYDFYHTASGNLKFDYRGWAKTQEAARAEIERGSQQEWINAPMLGRDLYGNLAKSLMRRLSGEELLDFKNQIGAFDSSQEAASKYLLSLGIPGLTYKGATSGERNYVIFDDSLVRIEGKLSVDATTDDILAPRARVAPLDAIARGVSTATGLTPASKWIIDQLLTKIGDRVPESVKAGVVDKYGLDEPYKQRRALAFASIRGHYRDGQRFIDALGQITRAEARIMHEWMTNPEARTDELERQLKPEQLERLKAMREHVDKIGLEAVRLGDLSNEVYERHKGAYLHRSYLRHEVEATEGEQRARARAVRILGDQYNLRGIKHEVSPDQVLSVLPKEWGLRAKKRGVEATFLGKKFIRFERYQNRGEGTATLDGMPDPAGKGKLLEVAYWPEGEAVPARLGDWYREQTWEARWAKGDKIVMHRDFTPDEQQKMGVIDEVRFAVARTLQKMGHDIEISRFLEWIADTHAKPDGKLPAGAIRVPAKEGLWRAFGKDEWVQVPDTEIGKTGVKKYGKLSGLWVPGPIWNDVRQLRTMGAFGPEWFQSMMRSWKLMKTALSPAVHMNNTMGNVFMADWHDVGARAIKDALEVMAKPEAPAHKQLIEEFEDDGGTQGMYVLSELQKNQLKPLLDQLRAEIAENGETIQTQVSAAHVATLLGERRFADAWAAAKLSKPGNFIRRGGQFMIDLYQDEDTVFRLAAYIQARRDGKSRLEAGKFARESFLDYDINAPWVQMARQTIFPFISFVYRAVPMIVRTARDRPWKLLKLAAVAGALNALAYAATGADEDDEREALPDEKRGKVLGFLVPKLLRMPWNRDGNPVFLDIRRFVPVGDIIDFEQTHTAIPVPPPMVPSGPIAILFELVLNRSAFTGQPIVKETDTLAEAAQKVLNHAYKSFTPNLPGLPATYSTERLMKAARGETDALGREYGVLEALASSVGVKFDRFPPDATMLRLAIERRRAAEEIELNIRRAARRVATGGMDRDDFDELRDREMAKLRAINEKLATRLAAARRLQEAAR